MSQSELRRALTTRDVVALGINGVIGGGIFLAPATAARLAGSWSIVVYLAAGLLIALIALCFAEVGSRFSRAGGPFLYAEEAFGPFIGFQVGWFSWLARITSMASLANGLVTYVAWGAPVVSAGAARLALMTLLFGALTVINVRGVTWGAKTINFLTVAKLAPLALFVIVGFAHIDASRLIPSGSLEGGRLAEAVLVMIFVFGGFEVLVFPSSEMVDPGRSIPKAIFATLITVAFIYLGVHCVAMGTLPDLASASAPLSSSAILFMGSAGAAVITVGAILSICGTESGTVLTTPRLLYAMAERGHLPSVLSRVHARYRTPAVAIIVQSALALGLAAAGSFESLARLSAMSRIVAYASTCLALPVLRRTLKESPPFRLPGGEWIVVAALALCGILFVNASRLELTMAAIAFGVGSGLHVLIPSSTEG